MNLTNFLLARLAEDEACLREVPIAARQTEDFDFGGTDDYLRFTMGYGRAVAECAAKRTIIDEHHTSEVASLDRATWGKMFEVCNTCAVGVRQVVVPCPTLKALAAVYKDHPDYRQEWAV